MRSMKIEDMREKVLYQFHQLEIGDVFQPVDYACIYVKTHTIEDTNEREFNCLCLNDGYMTRINPEIGVTLLDAKVVIE